MSLLAAMALTVSLAQSSGASPVALPEEDVHVVFREARDSPPTAWDWHRWQPVLAPVYEKHNYSLLWFSGDRLTAAADELLHELEAAQDRGLRVPDYDGAELRALALRSAGDTGLRARVDVALSVAAARFASDLHQGRVAPRELGYDLDATRPDFDAGAQVERLAAAARLSDILDGLEPRLRHYALLKSALRRYQELAQRPELTRLSPLPKRSLSAGDSYDDAPALRRLLVTLGDLDARDSAEGSRLDAAVAKALARFQSRHGLDADRILGPRTYRALTTPLSLRAEQVALSMERARWLPVLLETPPIIVNVPQFRLFAFRTTQDHEQDILQMDVIVGEDFEGRRTPVFAADMRYAVLNPYWDVPRSILQGELLPEIAADPQWIERNGFEIVSGNGDDATPQAVTPRAIQLLSRGTYRLRQAPGPLNALGRVKFVLPNRHGVYLHDTPARNLFSRTRRALSHGCIRVADPMGLLAHVLRTDPSWNLERIEAAMRSPGPVRIVLPEPIRVFLLYGTALVNEAGEDLFFEDLYQQDAPLMQLLATRRARATATMRE